MRRLRRIAALLLMLCLLLPTALAEDTLRGYDKKEGYVYVTLGSFPQTEAGDELPIVWRVLQVKDDRAYILSEYVLEARRIHGDYKQYANKPTAKYPGFNGDFTQTEMAQYLNGEFTENFTSGELALITPDPELGLTFTLLSSDELKDKSLGFGTDSSRKAWGTEYATTHGLFVYGSARGNHSPYWTRSQSSSNTQGARCIKSKGELGYINVITEDEGMRPACWLDMSRVVIIGGAGTLENPYILQTETAEQIPDAPAADEACCTPGECACCASCDCGCQN